MDWLKNSAPALVWKGIVNEKWGKVEFMKEENSKPMRSLKVAVMSLMILGACGAVAYNVLLQQDPKVLAGGSTAVRVQVNDIDIADVSGPKANGTSSIGQLLSRTSNGQGLSQNAKLTAMVQNQLAYLGFYKGSVDGQPGPQTLAAIKLYQQQNSLQPTGQVSRRLLEHLTFTRKISDASNNTGSIAPPAKGNADILKVQELLTLFGYMPGNPDGVLGRSTADAIRQFEADRSLPITGTITAALLQELGI